MSWLKNQTFALHQNKHLYLKASKNLHILSGLTAATFYRRQQNFLLAGMVNQVPKDHDP